MVIVIIGLLSGLIGYSIGFIHRNLELSKDIQRVENVREVYVRIIEREIEYKEDLKVQLTYWRNIANAYQFRFGDMK